MIIVLTGIMPPPHTSTLVTIITALPPPYGLTVQYDEKKLFPNDLSFSKLKCPHLLGTEDTMIKVDEKGKSRKPTNRSQHCKFLDANNFFLNVPDWEEGQKYSMSLNPFGPFPIEIPLYN